MAVSAARAFLLTAATSLAIGVGANVATFSLTSSLWSRSSGVREPATLGTVHFRPVAGTDGALVPSASAREAERLRELQRATVAFELFVPLDIGRWMNPRVRLASGERLEAAAVSANYFDVGGVSIVGRGFEASDDRQSRRVIVISERLARSRYGSAAAAVGRDLETDQGLVTIAGVAVGKFSGTRLGQKTEVWLPLGAMSQFSIVPADAMATIPLSPLVRRDASTSWRDIQEQLDVMTGNRAFVFSVADLGFVPTSLGALARQGELLRALNVVSALIFVASCFNLSGLLLARTSAKRHELAIRLALGARRRDVVLVVLRDFFSVLIVGLPASLFAAYAIARGVRHLRLPAGVAIDDLALSIDWRLGIFAAVLAVAMLALAGIVPTTRLVRADPSRLMSRSASGGDRRTSRNQGALVTAHVALSFVALAGAVSLTSRIAGLTSSRQGVETRALVASAVTPATETYLPVSEEGAARVVADFRTAIEKVGATAGVDYATYGDPPIATSGALTPIAVKMPARTVSVPLVIARGGAGYARALGATVESGQDLGAGDLGPGGATIERGGLRSDRGAVVGALVTESLSRVLWPNGDAVGSTFEMIGRQALVVGVVRDFLPGLPGRIRAGSIVLGSQPSGWLGASLPPILAHTETASGMAILNVDAAVRGAFRGETTVKTESFAQVLAVATANEQLGARLFGWFGGASSALGLLGVYGLGTLLVSSRQRDLAVRSALGVSLGALRWTAIAEIGRLVATGVATGAILTWVVAHAWASEIIGFDELGATAYVIAAVFLLAGGVAAAALGTAGIRLIEPAKLLNSAGR